MTTRSSSSLPLLLLCILTTCFNVSRSADQCEAMRYGYLCNSEYTHTHFPNSLGHRNQEEAYEAFISHLYFFYLDGNTDCHRDLDKFMCLIFFPKCTNTPSQTGVSHGPTVVGPCEDLCMDVKDSCEMIMQQIIPSYEWEYECSSFPRFGETCVRGARSRQRGIQYELEDFTPSLPELFECRGDQFRCADNRGCIPVSQRCDGLIDCRDMSDETACGYCSHNAFQCENEKCVNQLQVCDGIDNCGDGSDETSCGRGNLIQALINNVLICDCANSQIVVPSNTDACIAETILKVRVISVRQSSVKFRYKVRVERVLKGDRSLLHRTANYEMSKLDGCECVKEQYPPRKQLYISGLISVLRKKKGKRAINISETNIGSFVLPINKIDARDLKQKIKECRINSNNFSRQSAV